MEWILEYGIFVFLINFLSSCVVVYAFKNPGPVAASLEKYGDFAVHYMILSTVIALSLPYLEWSLKKRGLPFPVIFSENRSEPPMGSMGAGLSRLVYGGAEPASRQRQYVLGR
jgi:hypothetical protein